MTECFDRSVKRESSDWSGTDQSGQRVFIGGQTKGFDWSGERSVPIGREPSNRDNEAFLVCREPTGTEFLLVVKRSVLIGRAN